MIYAKDMRTEQILEHEWHDLVYDRRYVAVVSGEVMDEEGTVESWLKDNQAYYTYSSPVDNGGKYAITHFHMLNRTTTHSLVEFQLETGRKNQIRVHSADLGHPVCGQWDDFVFTPMCCVSPTPSIMSAWNFPRPYQPLSGLCSNNLPVLHV